MACIYCGVENNAMGTVCSKNPTQSYHVFPGTDKFQGVTEFIELLRLSKEIHLKKGADYATQQNPFSNFERSAELVSWFTGKVDKSFVALIGTKLARIAELSDGRTPNNESLDDSFLDLLTYVGLWASYVKRNRKT